MPCFTTLLLIKRLILQLSDFLDALFCKIWSSGTPYFTCSVVLGGCFLRWADGVPGGGLSLMLLGARHVLLGSRLVHVEVKAEENVRACSLSQFIKDNPGLKGLRLSMKGYANQEWMENVPLVAIDAFFDQK